MVCLPAHAQGVPGGANENVYNKRPMPFRLGKALTMAMRGPACFDYQAWPASKSTHALTSSGSVACSHASVACSDSPSRGASKAYSSLGLLTICRRSTARATTTCPLRPLRADLWAHFVHDGQFEGRPFRYGQARTVLSTAHVQAAGAWRPWRRLMGQHRTCSHASCSSSGRMPVQWKPVMGIWHER